MVAKVAMENEEAVLTETAAQKVAVAVVAEAQEVVEVAKTEVMVAPALEAQGPRRACMP